MTAPRDAAPLKLLLVEDNDEFRHTLELLLGLRPDVTVVGAVQDGARAATACVEVRPDVVVLDYRLPGLDSAEIARAILRECPGVAIVCLTGEVSEREEEALRAAGVVATLTKDERLDTIVDALHSAARHAA